MRKGTVPAACMAVLLLLTGCGGGHEPAELAVVRIVAVDGGGERMTATAFPAPAEGEEATAPSGSGGTAAEACLALTAEGGSFAFLGHTEHIPVGEELARDGLHRLLENAVLGDHMRPDSFVWVVQNGTGASWAERAGGNEVADALSALGTQRGAQRKGIAVTAAQALNRLLRSGAVAVPALADDRVEIAGYAVLKGQSGALAGYLEGDAAKGLELLMGEVCHNTAVLEGVTLEVTGVKTTVSPALEGGRLTGVTLSCSVTARRADGGYLGSDGLRAAGKEMEKRLTRQGERALEELVRLDADACGLAHRAAMAAPLHAQRVTQGWPEHLGDLAIDLQVRVHVDD